MALKFVFNALSGEFDIVQDLTAIEADIADLQAKSGKVLISGADTTWGYVYDKLTAGEGVELDILNPGANETLQITAKENFSYNKVISSKTLTIPENQQMLVADAIDVEGTLIIDGELQVLI